MAESNRMEQLMEQLTQQISQITQTFAQQFQQTLTAAMQECMEHRRNGDEGDVVLDCDEEKSPEFQLQIQQDGDLTDHEDENSIEAEVRDCTVLEAQIEASNPSIHPVFIHLIHDKVTSLPYIDFSSPILSGGTAIGKISPPEKEFPVADKVFDKSPKRNGYIACLNPKPPDVYDSRGPFQPAPAALTTSLRGWMAKTSSMPHSKHTVYIYPFDGSDDLRNHLEIDAPGQSCTKMTYSADGTRFFSCGSSNDGGSHIVEWNESEGAVKRSYFGLGKHTMDVVQFVMKNWFLVVGDEFVNKFWDIDNVNLLTTTDANGVLPASPCINFCKEGILLTVSTSENGGKSCLLSRDYPTFCIEWFDWFEKASFKHVHHRRISPKWSLGVCYDKFIILECYVTGVKPMSKYSSLQLGPNAEDGEKKVDPLVFLLHLILGAITGTYYVLVPSTALVLFVAPGSRAEQIFQGINGLNVYVTPYDFFELCNAHMFLQGVATHFAFLVRDETGNYIAKNDKIVLAFNCNANGAYFDLELLSHKVMVATVCCKEIANEKYSSFTANKDWCEVEEAVHSHPIKAFGKKLNSILDMYLSDCTECLMKPFDGGCANVIIRQTNWDSVKAQNKLWRDIDAQVAAVCIAKLSKLSSSYGKILNEALSTAAEALLNGFSDDIWPSIRKLLRRKNESVASAFSIAPTGFEMNEQDNELIATIIIWTIFYVVLRVDLKEDYLVWVEWNHPNMPYEKVELLVCCILKTISPLGTWDNGRPYAQAATAEEPTLVRLLHYYAKMVYKIHGLTVVPDGLHKVQIFHDPPIGVEGQRILWNFTFLLFTWKHGFALTACTHASVKDNFWTNEQLMVDYAIDGQHIFNTLGHGVGKWCQYWFLRNFWQGEGWMFIMEHGNYFHGFKLSSKLLDYNFCFVLMEDGHVELLDLGEDGEFTFLEHSRIVHRVLIAWVLQCNNVPCIDVLVILLVYAFTTELYYKHYKTAEYGMLLHEYGKETTEAYEVATFNKKILVCFPSCQKLHNSLKSIR